MAQKQISQIAVYHIKGGVGKTRIALNLALTLETAIITNDEYSIIEKVIDKGDFIILEQNDKLPNVPTNIPVIYDLGGKPDPRAEKILRQSQFVLLPILPEEEDLQIAINFIKEVQKYNNNIILIANKVKSGEFSEIKKVLNHFYADLPTFEIKHSRVMTHIIKEKKSVKDIAQQNKLNQRHYQKVADQFQEIIDYIHKNI